MAHTSTLACVCEHPLPPLSEQWAPYLPLGQTAPLTPGSADEFKCQSCLPVPQDGLCPSYCSSEHLLTFFQTCFFIYSALFAHVKSSDLAGCQNTSTTPAGGCQNEQSPLSAVQTVQIGLNNRRNRSHSV